jgi:hypothetical protein
MEGDRTIMSNKDRSKCLSQVDGSVYIQTSNFVWAWANSVLNDGQHNAHLAIDGKKDTYWASSLGYPQSVFWVGFSWIGIVKSFNIIWKYVPEAFNIYIWYEGWYRSIAKITGNSDK